MSAADGDVYYDPYDFEIDSDPYPVWKRLRDEAPLYYNERYDFYALSRFVDVNKALVDHETFSSARGAIVELIKANVNRPRLGLHARGNSVKTLPLTTNWSCQ